MMAMRPSVYIETSVISYYTSRMSRDMIVAAHQQITQEWWETVLPRCEAYVSPFVLDEIGAGDRQAAAKRLGVAASFRMLEVTPQVRSLADQYQRCLEIPATTQADAYHLAVAAWHDMDYLVTWNCRHLAAARVRAVLASVNATIGIRTPAIGTPEELMEF
jgi:predicted nucleic acid-binding protein